MKSQGDGCPRRGADEVSLVPRPQPAQGLFRAPARERVSDGDNFAPRRERFFCLRRPHFFQQRKKWGKERRQKLRFCTSSARYTALVSKLRPHAIGIFLPAVVPPTVPAQLSAAAACYYGKNYSFCCVAGYYILCPTGTPTFAAARRQRRDLIIAHPVEANTPTVAEASGRGSLRAGERRHSPFDRQ